MIDRVAGFAQLERNLAIVLVLTPLLLIIFDEGPDNVRSTISAYHDMAHPEPFFYPLTVAAMLFIVNGVLKHGHWYNWALGVLLSMVVLFDHDGATAIPHYTGAFGFFGGNVAAMAWFSTRKPVALKIGLIGTIIVALVLFVVADWFTLFWVEWVSLAIVATHYVLDSASWTKYQALTANDTAELMPAT
ncbi:hypothetical protein BH24ACT5_BH24ACT5_29840 [soil metagenome]